MKKIYVKKLVAYIFDLLFVLSIIILLVKQIAYVGII